MTLRGACLILLIACGGLAARADDDVVKALQRDGGFQEVVISVTDLDQATLFYRTVGGWRTLYRGAAAPELVAAWGLPERTKVIESVMQNPGDPLGFVRLVSVKGVKQERIRPSAQPWEPGAWAGMVLRARDVKAKYAQLLLHGWHGTAQPVEIKTPRLSALAAMFDGLAGESVLLQERLAPPLDGFAASKELSAPVQMLEVVKDVDAAAAFYVDKLGFKVIASDEGPLAGGRNLLGLPHNLAGNVYRRQKIVAPAASSADGRGAVVLTSYYGLRGDEFLDRDRPPNLGLLMARFPVSDANARAAEIKARGGAVDYQRADVRLEPYGSVTLFGVRDPNGALIEFFQP
jgi:catechol 2,3-dioxygenase-like lactoylglutathione lyase family enzyme